MMTLPKEKLLEYLKHAIELESSIIAQERIITTYNTNSDTRKPILYEKPLPNSVTYPTIGGYCPSQYRVLAFGAGLLLFFFMLLTNVIVPPENGFWAFNVVYDDGSSGVNAIYWCGIPALCCCLPLINGIRNHRQEVQEEQERYEYELQEYRRKKEQITIQNQEYYESYRNNLSEWNSSNKEMCDFLNAPLDSTKAALETLYSHEVIYPKYRTLPALTSIYEYLITGRCEELAGPHGAYNLYEDEIRKDTVISQLNTVIENLEQIRQNQYMLYEEVKGIQQATQVIATELQQIRGYTVYLTKLTELNAYYNGINAMNSTALAYCRSL